MRIAMISEHASPLAALGGADGGGQNVYVAQLARQLAQMGHQIDVFTRRESVAEPRVALLAPGVRVVHIDAGPPHVLPKEQLLPLMDAFAADMRAFCATEPGYDLVHAHFFMSALVALEIARHVGIPSVVTFHALGRVRRKHQREADGFPDARFAIEDRIVAEADRIIAECPEDERDLLGLYAADPARIRMIPCGFDPEEFRPLDRVAPRERLGLDPAEPIILQLGRMVPRKGIDTVIAGLARAHALGAHARLLVVGGASREPDPATSPELARLIAVAEAEGVADRVTFVGSRSRSELQDYYAAADIFVTTPWYEPFGITPLEAMACARPVVASDVGGLRYTVVDGETGVRVPPRNPRALGRVLADLIADPSRCRRMGEAGRVRVEERFTWRQVAIQMEEVYRETVAKQPRRVTAMPLKPERTLIAESFATLAATLTRASKVLDDPIREAAAVIGDALLADQKVLVCGNGGSAADAQHFAAEFVGRFRDEARRALPVIALGADTAFITAWANDIGFDDVFARGVRAFGRPGDVLVAISTSGRSPNIVAALKEAREQGLKTVALLGGALSPAVALADVAVRVPSTDTPRIQEVQTLVLHLLCELVEARMVADQQPAVPALPALPALIDAAS